MVASQLALNDMFAVLWFMHLWLPMTVDLVFCITRLLQPNELSRAFMGISVCFCIVASALQVPFWNWVVSTHIPTAVINCVAAAQIDFGKVYYHTISLLIGRELASFLPSLSVYAQVRHHMARHRVEDFSTQLLYSNKLRPHFFSALAIAGDVACRGPEFLSKHYQKLIAAALFFCAHLAWLVIRTIRDQHATDERPWTLSLSRACHKGCDCNECAICLSSMCTSPMSLARSRLSMQRNAVRLSACRVRPRFPVVLSATRAGGEVDRLRKLATLWCGHSFHAECLSQTFATTNRCPYCRASWGLQGMKDYVDDILSQIESKPTQAFVVVAATISEFIFVFVLSASNLFYGFLALLFLLFIGVGVGAQFYLLQHEGHLDGLFED